MLSCHRKILFTRAGFQWAAGEGPPAKRARGDLGMTPPKAVPGSLSSQVCVAPRAAAACARALATAGARSRYQTLHAVMGGDDKGVGKGAGAGKGAGVNS